MTKKRLHAALRQSKERRPAALRLSKKRRSAALRRPPAALHLSKKRRPAALRSPKSRLRLPKESWHAALRRSPGSLGRTSCRTVRRVSSRSQHRTPLPSCSPAPPLSPSPESPPGFKAITKSRWDISKVLPRQTCSFQTCSGACQMKSVNKPTNKVLMRSAG